MGYALEAFPAIALVSLGVGAIVAEAVVVFIIIKFLGAGLLMYLSLQAIRHCNDHTATSLRARLSSFRPIREGFFVAVLPQFASYETLPTR